MSHRAHHHTRWLNAENQRCDSYISTRRRSLRNHHRDTVMMTVLAIYTRRS